MLSTGTPALTVITTSEQSSPSVEPVICFSTNINKKKNRSVFHATASIRYQTNKSNLEQLFQSPRAVTNALNWYPGFVCHRHEEIRHWGVVLIANMPTGLETSCGTTSN